ncbi:MAG: hypothetical protein ACLFPE_14615 [Bacteroidales bacterium]
MDFLLSVDLGVKTGLAMFSSEGRLLWFRSQNFGNAARLRKAIPWLLNEEEDLSHLVIEGGGPLLKIWDAFLEKRNIEVIKTMADNWRHDLLLDREQRRAKSAKANAVIYARRVIEKLSDHKATSLNADAAEAIMIGLWASKKLGWIGNVNTILR